MRKIRKLYTQHILPLVYDYSMSLSEMVGKLTETVNVLAEDDEMTDHRLDVCEGNIEVLTDRVDLANRGVDNLERQINHIEEEIADIPTDERIQQLQDAIDANSSDIETLDSRVDILESRPDLSSAVAINTQNISTLQTAVAGKSTVSYNEIVQTGTKIGTITIDGTPTDLYAPSATVIPGADGISYDNTTSGLSATNVQDAIDEVDGAVDTLAGTVAGKSTVSVSQVVSTGTKIATVTVDSVGTDIYAPAQSTPTASQVSYDNTSSGMTATDVQAAIDEVEGSVGALSNAFYDYNLRPYGSFDIPISGQPLSGYLTSSGKLIRAAVPYRKSLKDSLSDYSANFIFDTTGNVEIRGVSGYVIPTAQAYGNISITVSLYETEMRLDITKSDSTPFNANINNTPVSIIFYGSGANIKITKRH